jgi:hypothetical protein
MTQMMRMCNRRGVILSLMQCGREKPAFLKGNVVTAVCCLAIVMVGVQRGGLLPIGAVLYAVHERPPLLAGTASEPGRASPIQLAVSRSPQPPSVEQSRKRGRARVAKAGAAALLVQLHVDSDDDLLEDGGQRGKCKGRKAGAALSGKLQPLGALQEAAVGASTVGTLCCSWIGLAAVCNHRCAYPWPVARAHACIMRTRVTVFFP